MDVYYDALVMLLFKSIVDMFSIILWITESKSRNNYVFVLSIYAYLG
uniref:XK-related protein n=1 Tax=Anguilla anguilla TaxID=7936 RepID=A0A0E9WJB2_ANGAN